MTEVIYLDCDAIYAEFDGVGKDWADKKAAADLLEDQKKICLSQCIMGAMLEDPKLSHAKAESIALCSESYGEFINKLGEARKAANLAKAKLDATKALWESRMCNSATQRAEMKIV